MKKLDFAQTIVGDYWERLNFDSMAFAVVDFKKKDFACFEWAKGESAPSTKNWFFDLASVTKPLTLAAGFFLRPECFGPEAILCLEHRGGLPSWGRLSHGAWREKILSFELKPSETLYSDYSAIRAQLLAEEKLKKSLFELTKVYQDKDVIHWLDLPANSNCPVTGQRNGKLITGQVHDDNAFYLGEKVAHAGLFGSITGVAQSLLNLDSQVQLLSKMVGLINEVDKSQPGQRFVRGFDRAQDFELTHAGKGAGPRTFGHLGFTGTSFWIDGEKQLGHILLTNATRHFWYAKDALSSLRRELGAATWKLS